MNMYSALVCGVLVAANAPAHEYQLGDLVIDHPWARATPPGVKTGAGYMTLRNTGDGVDRLLSVSAEVARRVELHAHDLQDNVLSMRPVEAVEIPANGEVALQPGGLHLMFIGLSSPFVEGQRFALTLTFENAGTVGVEVEVEKDR